MDSVVPAFAVEWWVWRDGHPLPDDQSDPIVDAYACYRACPSLGLARYWRDKIELDERDSDGRFKVWFGAGTHSIYHADLGGVAGFVLGEFIE